MCEPQERGNVGSLMKSCMKVTSMTTARQERGGDMLTTAAEDGIGWSPVCWLQPARIPEHSFPIG